MVGTKAMRTTTRRLLSLLQRYVGAEVSLVSEVVQDDGQIQIKWQQQLPPDERRLGPDPAITISADGEELRWDYSDWPFTYRDLAEADPANEENRHPMTKELAAFLGKRLRAAALASPSGSAAFVALLRRRRMWPTSAAALVASATGQDYWALLRHAKIAWRYPHNRGTPGDPPSYSWEEMAAAESIFAEEWFQNALREKCQEVRGVLVLPVISNVRFGPTVTGI